MGPLLYIYNPFSSNKFLVLAQSSRYDSGIFLLLCAEIGLEGGPGRLQEAEGHGHSFWYLRYGSNSRMKQDRYQLNQY